MDALKQFLKDYGPAVGPALAFAFGLLALIAKHKVDQWTARWSLARRLRNLERLVADFGPPQTFFPQLSEGFIDAGELRNLTNLARFYTRLLALRPVFNSLVDPIAEIGTTEQIARLHGMKWWFDIILTQVEQWRETENFRMSRSDLNSLQGHWKSLQKAASNPEEQLEYISRRPG